VLTVSRIVVAATFNVVATPHAIMADLIPVVEQIAVVLVALVRAEVAVVAVVETVEEADTDKCIF
jgi:hypothetical protein